ncbi:hypothetical protein M514_04161 [Trichuris suis]|uniref:Uncharacterized protein n=1 Tax=Trichuris suis TaxID=68888 RepID=A0A085MWL1_9BILA|nr:hypothetical protein M513_04161 [Trichuris suis]KFD61607.1 hypothetical protein M514_04161 [Trichuris suis]
MLRKGKRNIKNDTLRQHEYTLHLYQLKLDYMPILGAYCCVGSNSRDLLDDSFKKPLMGKAISMDGNWESLDKCGSTP